MASLISAYNIYSRTQRQITTTTNTGQVVQALNDYLVRNGHYPCPAPIDVPPDKPEFGVSGDCTATGQAVGTFQPSYNAAGVHTGSGVYIQESQTAVGGSNLLCGEGDENTNITLTAPPGNVIQSITFASYGTPSGICGSYNVGACNSTSSKTVVEGIVLGLNSATFAATNANFGDPCSGTFKRMRVSALYGPPTGPVAGTFQRVRVGGVPFRTLGMDESYADDGYNNRIRYAVTEPLARTAADYTRNGGGISVIDDVETTAGSGDYRKLDNGSGQVHFVIMSSGEDGAGAYTHFGKIGVPCSAVAKDGVNCAGGNKAIFKITNYSSTTKATNEATHYDDVIKFYASSDTPLWRIADPAGHDIRDLVDAESTGKIGVKTSSPTQTLDARGTIKTDTSTTVGDYVCRNDGTACITNAEIAKGASPASPKYNCGGLKPPFAVGFSHDAIDCTTASAVNVACPSGSIMDAINADGTIHCSSVLKCATRTVALCVPDTFTLPSALPGAIVGTTPVSGISYGQTWQCQSDGQWGKIGESGICSCSAIDTDENLGCPSFGFTGTHTRHHTHTCPADTDSYTNDINLCTCVPDTKTEYLSCGSAYTSGSITKVTPWLCNADLKSGYFGTPTYPSNTCTCAAQAPQTRTTSCPTAFSGYLSQQRVWTCGGSGGSWSAWATIPGGDHCTCAGATETRAATCPSGMTGADNQRRDYDCGSGTWGAWTTYDNECFITLYFWKMKSISGSGSLPRTIQANTTCSTYSDTANCSAALPGGGGYQYGTCSCE